MTRPGLGLLAASLLLLTTTSLAAQDPPPDPPVATTATAAQEAEPRQTGLPSRITWTFNFDAGWGSFGFANSLFTNPKEPGVVADLSDQWFEGFARPALSATHTFDGSSEIYGRLSVVGERTYGSVPASFGEDVSSFGPEDLSIGWRSGDPSNTGAHLFDVVVGRTGYQLGHGFLLWDGAAEGGSRGGYWTNARKAFALAAIGRVQPGPHKVELFYLDKDELEENDSGSRLWGGNYEYRVAEHTTLGATYMKWFADPAIAPQRDGLNVVNLRAYTSPLPGTPDLSFELEYAGERNGEALDSNGWTIGGGYQLSAVTWKPKLSYRYASFQGDNPDTMANEAYDPLFLGFHDWGTWWQGEIAGEYFLSNSNLTSHLLRLHVEPSEALSGGLMLYKFGFDQPRAVGPAVTATDAAFELDAYADWKLNENVTVSFVGAYADPGKAIQQATGRTKNFAYGMAYVAYSF